MIAGLLQSALAEETSSERLEAWLAREAPDGTDVHELARVVGDYLRAVPGALDALVAMTKEPPLGRSVAFAAGQVLLYLVDEDDLFDDRELGALGLLDDAYLIHSCLAALHATFPGLQVPASYSAPEPRAVAAVRTLLPAGVASALDRSCERLVGVAATLYSGGGQGTQDGEVVRPALRVGDALATLG